MINVERRRRGAALTPELIVVIGAALAATAMLRAREDAVLKKYCYDVACRKSGTAAIHCRWLGGIESGTAWDHL
jgi:hypothetical protein